MTLDEAEDKIYQLAEEEENKDIQAGLYSALYWISKVDKKEGEA